MSWRGDTRVIYNGEVIFNKVSSKDLTRESVNPMIKVSIVKGDGVEDWRKLEERLKDTNQVHDLKPFVYQR